MIVVRGIMPLNNVGADIDLSLCADGSIIHVFDLTTAVILAFGTRALAIWSKIIIKGFHERGLAVLKYNKLLLSQLEHFVNGF